MRKKAISLMTLVISDLTVILLSFSIAYFIRSKFLLQFFSVFENKPLLPFSVFLKHYYFASLWIIIFAYEKLYTKRFAIWDEVKTLIKSATISSSLIIIFIFITRTQQNFSRTMVILAWVFSLFLFPIFRYYIKILLVKTNLWKKKLLMIGVAESSLKILKSIKTNKTMGYEILGFLDNDPQKMGKSFLGIQVIGNFSDLGNIATNYKSKDIMIVTPHTSRIDLKKFLTRCESLSESMWLIPRSADFITEGVEIEIIGDVLTLYRKRNLAKPWNIFIKTVFELCLTFILMILFLPLFLIISIVIKLDSKGPIIYVQKRVGKGGMDFNLYKFRSMFQNGEERLKDYFEKNPDTREEWVKYKKLKNYDPRITKVGKILRKYSLDELPQLLNVIQRKMNLVGPRPYLPEELEGREFFFDMVSKIKPGITGLWQISGRSELPFEKRLALDEYYIRNWSLWSDIVILLKSIKVLTSREGAY